MELLPLFPLNTVLFPGMPIHLHIFEDRYKLMIGRCIEKRQPFGVVLIQSGEEVQGFGAPAQPYPVGCMAHITTVQPLGDGRMNIVALGYERFRILEQFHHEPYLTGMVEKLSLHNDDMSVLQAPAARLRVWFRRYLAALERIENATYDASTLPSNPIAMSYLAASVLRIESTEKQLLLDEGDASRLLSAVTKLYRREVTLLEIVSNRLNDDHFVGPFSVN